MAGTVRFGTIPAMPRKPTPDARERILGAAARLFDRHGIRAVGMQHIIDECECGKNLLYTQFASKDDLVVAYLTRRRTDWDALVARIRADEGGPEQQLVALVRAVGARVTAPGARGCPLRDVFAEFPEPGHPAHRVALDHFARVRAQLRELAAGTPAPEPDRLADRILIVIEGLHATGRAFGDEAVKAAVAFAEDVVRAECG